MYRPGTTVYVTEKHEEEGQRPLNVGERLYVDYYVPASSPYEEDFYLVDDDLEQALYHAFGRLSIPSAKITDTPHPGNFAI